MFMLAIPDKAKIPQVKPMFKWFTFAGSKLQGMGFGTESACQ